MAEIQKDPEVIYEVNTERFDAWMKKAKYTSPTDMDIKTKKEDRHLARQTIEKYFFYLLRDIT